MRLFLSFLDTAKHTYAHAGPDEAQMMSTVIHMSPLASFSVIVSSREAEVCLLVSVCVFVCDSWRTVNYVILLVLLRRDLIEQLFMSLCVCLSPRPG